MQMALKPAIWFKPGITQIPNCKLSANVPPELMVDLALLQSAQQDWPQEITDDISVFNFGDYVKNTFKHDLPD